MATKTRSTVKQKKIWYQVLAPKEFRNEVIGETLSSEPEKIVGRIMKINLADLTRDVKSQSIEIQLEITEIKGQQANTIVKQYMLMPNHTRRVVRTGKSKIEDSFTLKTKDNVSVQIKPLFIAISLVQNSIGSALRKTTRAYFADLFKNTDFSNIFLLLVSNKLQSALRAELKKIYPLATCQIRMFRRLK